MTRIAVFAFIGLLAAPRIVLAHARLMSPAPRDQKDGYKDAPQGPGGPCGIARSASQPSTNMTPGAAVTVTWEETVDHNGCFVIDFSAADDQNFTVIGRKSHANPPAKTGTPATRKYSMQVTLPSTPCTACTLRVRQLMLASNVAEANLATGCPPATVASGSTY